MDQVLGGAFANQGAHVLAVQADVDELGRKPDVGVTLPDGAKDDGLQQVLRGVAHLAGLGSVWNVDRSLSRRGAW